MMVLFFMKDKEVSGGNREMNGTRNRAPLAGIPTVGQKGLAATICASFPT